MSVGDKFILNGEIRQVLHVYIKVCDDHCSVEIAFNILTTKQNEFRQTYTFAMDEFVDQLVIPIRSPEPIIID